jgi:cyanophycinase
MSVFFKSVLCLLLLAAMASSHAAQPGGSLVIAGGALRADTADVWQRIVLLAGGPGARIAVIPAAAVNPQRSGQITVDILKRYGADAFVIPIAPLLPGELRQMANDPALAALLNDAGGVFFTGGEQSRITQTLIEPDGSRSALLAAIWKVHARGGVIAGTSAGAAIMSQTMFFQPDTTLSVLQGGPAAARVLAPGLGFIGDKVFVDQHFLARGRFGRMLPALRHAHLDLGIGVDENTAIAVTGQDQVEVLGDSGVIVMDLRHSSGNSAVRNVRLSYLERGDRFTLSTRIVTPSVEKMQGRRIDPAAADFDPFEDAPQFYPDVLGFNVLKTLMTNLIDNRQREVIGLAFGMPGLPMPEKGFEFRFRKSPQALGYTVNGPDRNRYTVLGIEMDMTPVTMSLPLYKTTR